MVRTVVIDLLRAGAVTRDRRRDRLRTARLETTAGFYQYRDTPELIEPAIRAFLEDLRARNASR
jgi:hypothetical protein